MVCRRVYKSGAHCDLLAAYVFHHGSFLVVVFQLAATHADGFARVQKVGQADLRRVHNFVLVCGAVVLILQLLHGFRVFRVIGICRHFHIFPLHLGHGHLCDPAVHGAVGRPCRVVDVLGNVRFAALCNEVVFARKFLGRKIQALAFFCVKRRDADLVVVVNPAVHIAQVVKQHHVRANEFPVRRTDAIVISVRTFRGKAARAALTIQGQNAVLLLHLTAHAGCHAAYFSGVQVDINFVRPDHQLSVQFRKLLLPGDYFFNHPVVVVKAAALHNNHVSVRFIHVCGIFPSAHLCASGSHLHRRVRLRGDVSAVNHLAVSGALGAVQAVPCADLRLCLVLLIMHACLVHPLTPSRQASSPSPSASGQMPRPGIQRSGFSPGRGSDRFCHYCPWGRFRLRQ